MDESLGNPDADKKYYNANFRCFGAILIARWMKYESRFGYRKAAGLRGLRPALQVLLRPA
jgi:hypothetical protein